MKLAAREENWPHVSRLERGDLLSDTIDRRAADAEAELLEACRERDVSAFERLYQTHGARMKSLAANLLGNRSDAEDAVQETFLKIYRAASSFRAAAKLSTWTYRVLVNTCYDLLRRRRRSEGRDLTQRLAHEAPETERNHPLRLDLETALASLDEKRRTAFLLSQVEGFTHREVGDVLGVPEETSRTLLFEARRALQRMLAARGTIGGEARP